MHCFVTTRLRRRILTSAELSLAGLTHHANPADGGKRSGVGERQALREPESAALAGGAGRPVCRDCLAGHQASLPSEFIHDREPPLNAAGCIDDHGHDRYAPAQLPEGIAVWIVVAVISPDAAQA